MSKHDRDEWCVHYNGFSNKPGVCRAGVNYKELGGDHECLTLPCVPSFRVEFKPWSELPVLPDPIACDKCRYPTPEEITERERLMAERFERMTKIAEAVNADAKAKGFKKGSGGSSNIVCPVCAGTVHYGVASYNGHKSVRCSTPNCGSWIQ